MLQVSFVKMAPDALDRVSQAALKKFTQFDANRDGSIDRNELDAILIDMGLPFPTQAVDKLFAQFDRNRDGSLTVEEFRGMIDKLNFLVSGRRR
jgi:Ca2+-binding EF-hand superfamily protein